MAGQKFPLSDREPVELIVLASAARTAAISSADFVNYSGKGLKVFIDVTLDAALASVTFKIEVKDPVSGIYTAVLTSAAIVAVGHTVLTLYPGITVVANVSASDALPRTWRVTATPVDTDAMTYSVGASIIN